MSWLLIWVTVTIPSKWIGATLITKIITPDLEYVCEPTCLLTFTGASQASTSTYSRSDYEYSYLCYPTRLLGMVTVSYINNQDISHWIIGCCHRITWYLWFGQSDWRATNHALMPRIFSKVIRHPFTYGIWTSGNGTIFSHEQRRGWGLPGFFALPFCYAALPSLLP